jgi:hypothetical protein
MNPAAEPIEISNRPVAALRAWLAVAGIPEGTVSRAVTPYSGPFVAIPMAIRAGGNSRMSARADDYRLKARAADRGAAQTSDPHIRGAYEQITRDWLALAEQVEWIGSYGWTPANNNIETKMNAAATKEK